jgi:hypothetical protein
MYVSVVLGSDLEADHLNIPALEEQAWHLLIEQAYTSSQFTELLSDWICHHQLELNLVPLDHNLILVLPCAAAGSTWRVE